jgi:hypothetical protein
VEGTYYILLGTRTSRFLFICLAMLSLDYLSVSCIFWKIFRPRIKGRWESYHALCDFYLFSFYFIFLFILVVLGFELRTLCLLDRYCTAESHLQPFSLLLFWT